MNIAGQEVSMPSVNWAGTMQTVAIWGIAGILLIALGIWLFMRFKDKGTFIYPVTLRVRRENGNIKSRFDIMGGIVSGKNGVKTFKCKIPKKYGKFDLGYMPDFSWADMNNRLSFIQEGDSTMWQQTKEELVTEKYIPLTNADGSPKMNEDGTAQQVAVYKMLIEPIPTDTKTTTYNNLQSTRELMDLKKLTAWGISIIAFVVMVIAHLISLFIQTKIKCGVA